jgi:hypothetical protein
MKKGKDLQTEEIEQLLQELGSEMAAQGLASVQIMVLGGAYMLINVGNRATTQDIDVFPLNFIDSSQPDDHTKTILKAVQAIAKAHGLKRDWLNDAAYGILGWMMPPTEQLQLWRAYGPLEVYMPQADFILAAKLFGYRDRDFNDVQALLSRLHIETREQAQEILDRYIDRRTQLEYRTPVTLDDLFDE